MAFPRPEHLAPSRLADLASSLGLRIDGPDAEVEIRGVTLDSRAVRPGDLYAALPGANVHGAAFAEQAIAAGAAALLTDDAGAAVAASALAARPVPVLVVPDPRRVLGELSARIYGTHDTPLTLVGITGTNGKTTTAYLVSSALEALGRHTGLIGTVETRLGTERVRSERTTPEATDLHALFAVMAERGLDTCVMEVSSHALALDRVGGAVFDLALFTNLSQDHLDFHADLEDYFGAKALLFTPERARHGLVCVDDEWGRALTGRAGIPVTTLTTVAGVEADYTVVVDADDPAAFVLRWGGGELELRSALPGSFNVTNTALAAATLLLLGVGPRECADAVLADPHVPGRMERVAVAAGQPLAVVDYAHTPDAVAAALAALRPAARGPLVVVVGAGGDRDRGKRAAMGRAAALGADVVVVTDDNPRGEDPAQIRAALLAGARDAVPADGGRAPEIHEIADRRAAIAFAVARASQAGPGAAVAVVGKGHETGQEIAGVTHPFDDRIELQAALRAAAEGPGTA